MPDTLVDSNVLLDLLTADPRWLEWSSEALEAAGSEGRLLLNPIVYAEVSVDFERIERQRHGSRTTAGSGGARGCIGDARHRITS